MSHSRDPKNDYRAPEIVELGTLEDLTLGGTNPGTDGPSGAS